MKARTIVLGAVILCGAVFAQNGDDHAKGESDESSQVIESEFEKERENPSGADSPPSRASTGRSDAVNSPAHPISYVDQSGRSYTLDMLASVDLVGEWDKQKPAITRNELDVREVHVGFFGAVDHLAEGTLILMGHRMDGEFKFMVHEGYFSFPGLIPSTTLKVGKILYDAGRINTVHRMMWPFTDAPLVYKELLAENGASDTGGEARVLMPWTFWQELSVGVFNGKTFGHAMSDGPNKQNPLFTSHLKQFFNLGDNLGTQFGVSYLRFHPDPNPNKISHQTGIDFLLKWKNGYMKSFQWMAEVWYRETRQKNERPYDQPAPPVDTRWGSYSFWEYQIDESWFIGLRMDYFTVPTLRGKLGYTFPNGRAEESIVLTYRPSHFSYFRVTAVRGTTIETGKHDFRYYFQADFLLGKHPAHAY